MWNERTAFNPEELMSEEYFRFIEFEYGDRFKARLKEIVELQYMLHKEEVALKNLIRDFQANGLDRE